MTDIRCPCCKTSHRPGKLLLRADVVKGEIKCPRCGRLHPEDDDFCPQCGLPREERLRILKVVRLLAEK